MPPSPQRFFHFFVPMEPPHVLNRRRIDEWRERLEAGERPLAVGVSVLDVKTIPWAAGDGADPELLLGAEWCLATYLIDGHHKVQAASEAHLPVGLLSFIARRPSIAADEDIAAVLRELSSWKA